MNIFLLLTIAMVLIIAMLRRHIPIGPCMLAGGLLIWAIKAPNVTLRYVPGNRASRQRRSSRHGPLSATDFFQQ